MRLGAYEKKCDGKETCVEPELVEWFNVSGDTDDFIYFGEEKTCSER